MFTDSIITVAKQVAILFIMMAAGAFVFRLGKLDNKGVKTLVFIVLYFATPCLIVESLQLSVSDALLKNILITSVLALASYVLGIAASTAVFRGSPSKTAVCRFGTVFSNCGFMGLPLAKAVAGAEGVLYVSIFVVIFNALVWSYGIGLFRQENDRSKRIKMLVNPGIIGFAAGLVLFLLKIRLPEILLAPVEAFASLNTPLAMLIIGAYIARADLHCVLADKSLWLSVALRLAVLPAVCLTIFSFLPIDRTLFVSAMIPVSAPTAGMLTIFADRYDSDTKKAAALIAVSTLLSVITMPLIVSLAQIL